MSNLDVRIRLLETKNSNSKVKIFIFELLDDCKFVYQPGQFVSLHLATEEGKPLRRSYSIANLDHESNLLEFAVTLVQDGLGTKSLCNLKLGDIIIASSPRGKFTFRDTISARQILIGTGTGIVPYRNMLKQVERYLQNPHNSCIIVQGVKNRGEILFEDDFMKLRHYKNFDFKICLSREDIFTPRESHEINGYVQDSFSNIKPNPNTDIVYLCGNPYMIEDVDLILKNLGFSSEKIVKEQYYAKVKQK